MDEMQSSSSSASSSRISTPPPPGYSSPNLANPYPQPQQHATQPNFPHRRSATIIPILSPTLSEPSSSISHSLYNGKSSHSRRPSIDSEDEEEAGETTSLLGKGEKAKWYKGPYVEAGIKMGILFVVFTAVLAGTFWFGLPKLEPEDKAILKIPHSFEDLQALNSLFQKYKRLYPLRILACGVVTYLFVQTFSLPGSMYVSIIFGAAYGIIIGALLSCLCESVGSLLCYALSAICTPPLLTLPFYRARVETWRIKIMGDPAKGKQVSKGDLFAFLTVMRIFPFPPHWVTNFVAPHLGIGVFLFWLTCFIGIAPVAFIHVTIGASLDTMTSAADFHILSVRNILGIVGVIVAILIPVGLKRVFKKDLSDLDEAVSAVENSDMRSTTIDVPAVGDMNTPRRYQAIDSGVVLAGPSPGDPNLDDQLPASGDRKGKGRMMNGKGKGRAVEIIPDIQEESEEGSYDVFDRNGEIRNVDIKRGNEKLNGLGKFKGYGAIDMGFNNNWRDTSDPIFPFAR